MNYARNFYSRGKKQGLVYQMPESITGLYFFFKLLQEMKLVIKQPVT